jgi:pyridoxamine 5'-phosphate oxidase
MKGWAIMAHSCISENGEKMEHPIVKFNKWWEAALKDTPLKQKSAVCVSTIDNNGFPTGRFVDLKGVTENGFTFCTYLDSKKGIEISANSKIAMTAWWDHVGLQVRVTGFALALAEEEATQFWELRSRDAQLTTLCSKQSQNLESETLLSEELLKAKELFRGKNIPKPYNWGGFTIQPLTIEFLTFNDNRLHLREFFEINSGDWSKELLQP